FVLRLQVALTNCKVNNKSDETCSVPRGVDVMGYHDRGDIPNYWAYADNFVLQDRMFAQTVSWSLPAHLFMVSGWSANCKTYDNPFTCENDIALLPRETVIRTVSKAATRVQLMMGLQWLT